MLRTAALACAALVTGAPAFACNPWDPHAATITVPPDGTNFLVWGMHPVAVTVCVAPLEKPKSGARLALHTDDDTSRFVDIFPNDCTAATGRKIWLTYQGSPSAPDLTARFCIDALYEGEPRRKR